MSILDIRDHFERQGTIGDFHLFALQMATLKYAALGIKNLYCKFMDALVPGLVYIGVCTDGSRSITGRTVGLAMRPQQDIPSGFMRT